VLQANVQVRIVNFTKGTLPSFQFHITNLLKVQNCTLPSVYPTLLINYFYFLNGLSHGEMIFQEIL